MSIIDKIAKDFKNRHNQRCNMALSTRYIYRWNPTLLNPFNFVQTYQELRFFRKCVVSKFSIKWQYIKRWRTICNH